MEQIIVLVEYLIKQCGLTGNAVMWVRHGILITIVVALAWGVYRLCRGIVLPLVARLTRRTANDWDDILLGRPVLLAACGIVPAIVVWQLLPVVFFQFPLLQELFNRLTAVYITIATVRLFVVFINNLKLIESGHHANLHQYVSSFCGLLQVVVIFVAIIIVVSIIINRNPVTLFAGLGAMSAVLMLVFKDTIEGLVAGIRLTSADMLHVGDWITVPSTTADGTVIEMNLTTVKVRNFDNTIVTVSPMTRVSGSFQNWKGMEASGMRRVNRKVFFDVRSIKFVDEKREETNMSRYREALEKYIAGRSEVNSNALVLVSQDEATPSGLPLSLLFFIDNKGSVHYQHTLASVMEYAYILAGEYGLRLYEHFPEQ